MTRLSRIAGAALLAAAGASTPAGATGTITCQSLDEANAFVEMTIGNAATPKPVSVRIDLGDAHWSSLTDEDKKDDGEVRLVTIAQAFVDPTMLRLDIADENVQEIVASLRILRVEEDGEPHQVGYLHIPGRAVHPLICTGP